MELTIQLNGRQRDLADLSSPSPLDKIITALELKADRIAVEHNGQIVPRATWPATAVQTGDKLEIVHFVGGGLGAGQLPQQRLPALAVIRPSTQ